MLSFTLAGAQVEVLWHEHKHCFMDFYTNPHIKTSSTFQMYLDSMSKLLGFEFDNVYCLPQSTATLNNSKQICFRKSSPHPSVLPQYKFSHKFNSVP